MLSASVQFTRTNTMNTQQTVHPPPANAGFCMMESAVPLLWFFFLTEINEPVGTRPEVSTGADTNIILHGPTPLLPGNEPL